MPSSTIESCARVRQTVPLSAFGQMIVLSLNALQKDKDRRHRTTKALRCRHGVHGKQRRDRRTAAAQAPSAPAHSDRRSRAACPLRRLRARSSFLCEVRSLAQTLKDRTQQCWIGAALYTDHRPAGQLDVDRAGSRCLLLCGRLRRRDLTRCTNRHRKQGSGPHFPLHQLAPKKLTTPLEHLVGVHAMRLRNPRHARTRLQRQIDNPPLLRNRPKSAYATCCPRFLCNNHDAIIGLTPEPMPEGKTERLRWGMTRALTSCGWLLPGPSPADRWAGGTSCNRGAGRAGLSRDIHCP